MQIIKLYTYQKPGHDITVKHKPLRDYTEETGVYYRFAQYLKWPSWVWAFPSLEDYHTELCLSYMEIPSSWVLWRLNIPAEKIRWLYFQKQMNVCLPMAKNFALDEDTIRKDNDLPLALIRAPLKKGWAERDEPRKSKLQIYNEATI
jgi:hypothetical protein